MQWLTKKTIIKTFLMAILVVGMTISPLPQFILASSLLILNLYATYKQLSPKGNIGLLLGTIILAPLTITPLMGSVLSSLFFLPAIYLLDQDLKEHSLTQTLQLQKRTREPTLLFKSNLIALGVILISSVILVNMTIVLATIILIAYFTGAISIAILKTPKKPIREIKTWSRILVGNTEKKTIPLTTTTKQPIYLAITSLQTWVRIKQSICLLQDDKNVDIEVTFTPPLAGPTKIQLNASTLDRRGLIQTVQLLEPIELQVIPRAKYAQWLAKKYLEHSGSGASALAATLSLKALKSTRKSTEYYGNRPYQPGDKLGDIDWKHTVTLGELIVKEFKGSHGQPVIIVVNLTATDVQDADKLVYNLVMAALTAATESLPVGLACFNQKEALSATGTTNPRETIKKAFKNIEKITIKPQLTKILQTTELHKHKRKGQLYETTPEPKVKVTEILDFEYETLQSAVKQHPATVALTTCVEKTATPAVITVASTRSGDEEALMVTLQKLKERGYRIITI